MIGKKSFIYKQPVNDRMGILGIDYNQKNYLTEEFHFYLQTKVEFVLFCFGNKIT